MWVVFFLKASPLCTVQTNILYVTLCPQPDVEMKEIVRTYSMAISQSTGYLEMHLASFSRILFAINWRFLLTLDCFGSGCEGWQMWLRWVLVSLPLRGPLPFHQQEQQDFIIKYELYCYFNIVFCGTLLVVESCHRLTTCPYLVSVPLVLKI